MQMKKAQQIRNDWGDKPCDHPDFDREILLGCDTGDYICVQCGEYLTKQEREAINTKRKKQLWALFLT